MDLNDIQKIFIYLPKKDEPSALSLKDHLCATVLAGDIKALKSICTKVTVSDLNTPMFLKVLIENFSPQALHVLTEKGLDHNKILDPQKVSGTPNRDFWTWWWSTMPSINEIETQWSHLIQDLKKMDLGKNPFDFFNEGSRRSSPQFMHVLKIFENPFIPFVTENIQDKLTPHQWRIIASFPQMVWGKDTKKWADKDEWPKPRGENLNRFLNFVNNVPSAKNALDQWFSQTKKSSAWWEKTCSVQKVSDFALISDLPVDKQKPAVRYINKGIMPNMVLHLKKMGYSVNWILRTYMPDEIVCCPGYETLPTTTQHKIQQANCVSNLFDMVVSFGWEGLQYLEPTAAVQNKVCEALTRPNVLYKWLSTESLSNYSKIFKKFPAVLQWRDQHGNSLGHWMTFIEGADKKTIDLLCKNTILCTKNNAGYSPRDLFGDNIEDGLLTQYDKAAISHAIAPHRSQKRPTAPRRKM